VVDEPFKVVPVALWPEVTTAEVPAKALIKLLYLEQS
jgi:hypothetical protein